MGEEEDIRNVHTSPLSKQTRTPGSVEAAPLKGMLEREKRKQE